MTDTATASYDEHYRPWVKEIEAMRQVAEALDGLNYDARMRVMDWVKAKFNPPRFHIDNDGTFIPLKGWSITSNDTSSGAWHNLDPS